MQTKSFKIRVKQDADSGLADGEFVGYASVFGNRDSYGEVVARGAFAESLAEWKESGLPIPVLWGHNMADPDFNIGEVLSAEEDERGLKVHVRIDMESPKGPQVYRLLKGGRVSQMSFAFDVLDGAESEVDGEWAYELRRLKLYEVSVVPIGANPDTEILAVKAAAGAMLARAGTAMSAKSAETLRGVHEQLGQAHSLIGDLLAGSEGQKDQDQASGEEPPTGTPKASPDPATPSPSASLALTMQLLQLSDEG